MATVYLARDRKHDRAVAIKVLRPELAAILGAERFLKEIRLTANLQHPHILPLHDSGTADGLVYYVMPFVAGESLRDRLKRDKQLSVDEAVRIAREVASALDYAHRHGVVHRDIKPENILLHDGQALVADFGIALAISSVGGERMTETGLSVGTPHYMSPEQAMGEREITPRSDVYALGCVTYEMMLGEPPFTGPSAQAIIARVVTEEPRSLMLQRRTIPAHVEDAVLTALSQAPRRPLRHRRRVLGRARRHARAREATPRRASPRSAPPRRSGGAAAPSMIAGGALAVAGGLRRRLDQQSHAGRHRARPRSSPSPSRRRNGSPVRPSVRSRSPPTAPPSSTSARAATASSSIAGASTNSSPRRSPAPRARAIPPSPPTAAGSRTISAFGVFKAPLSGGGPVKVPTPEETLQAWIWGDDDNFIVTTEEGSLALLKADGTTQRIASPDAEKGEQELAPWGVLPGGAILDDRVDHRRGGAAARGRREDGRAQRPLADDGRRRRLRPRLPRLGAAGRLPLRRRVRSASSTR